MLDFYERVGYNIPWIGYLAEHDGKYVGSCGFKGSPNNNMVEIAYLTFDDFRQQGYATMMCEAMCNLIDSEHPDITMMGRTLPEENYSTRILRQYGFVNMGEVIDEDGELVHQWERHINR